jgi:hypothetical protein
MGLMCFSCEDQYPSGIVDKNGYDIFGQAVSGKIVTGEVRFDCLNCGRTVVRLPSLTSPPAEAIASALQGAVCG